MSQGCFNGENILLVNGEGCHSTKKNIFLRVFENDAIKDRVLFEKENEIKTGRLN